MERIEEERDEARGRFSDGLSVGCGGVIAGKEEGGGSLDNDKDNDDVFSRSASPVASSFPSHLL